MPGFSIELQIGKPLHRVICNAVRERINASRKNSTRSKFAARWEEAEKRSVAYLPERDHDSVRRANRTGGKPEYTTIQVPYTMAVLLTSHTYWTTVFLGRDPVFQLSGLHGEGEQQVMANESLLAYQRSIGVMGPHLHTWLYDVGKYGHSVVGHYWDEEISYVSEIIEKPALSFGGVEISSSKKVRQTRRVKGYQGNKLYNVRPADFYHDPRVTLFDFQSGEFCAAWTSISWNRLIMGSKEGKYINVEQLINKQKDRKKGVNHKGSTDAREQGSVVVDLPDTSEFGSHHVSGGLAGDVANVYECYIELIPKDWNLGRSDFPEKWVFTVTDDFEVVLGAEPMGNLHNKFPFDVLQLEPEGYSIYNRGIPEITTGVQDTIDWLINTHFYNVRKTLNNEYVVDPSKVNMKDLLNPLPGNLIRLKPSAYGTDARLAIHQLQTNDVTRTHINDIDMMLALGERITGVNDQVMGVANQSSRRSATEIRSTNTFSTNRLKTSAEYMSEVGFAPLTRKLVQNNQQYYDAAMKFRLTGVAAQLQNSKFIDVTPEEIAGSYDFVAVDGTLPVDRFAQANLWRALMGEMRNFPPIMQQYDISKIFSYVAQLTGLKNIEQFRIEVVPDGLLQQAAQQGNIIPLDGSAGGSVGGPNGPEPGQLEGQGDTL